MSVTLGDERLALGFDHFLSRMGDVFLEHAQKALSIAFTL